MSEKEQPLAAGSADEAFVQGSKEAIDDTFQKLDNGVKDIRAESITLVNHHHQHYYGDPNASLDNKSDNGSIFSTVAKIALGGMAVFGGIKLISSGGEDIKKLEEDKQKAIEAKEANEIKVLALNNEEKYSWYTYDDKTLLQSNDIKTDKQYLFSIYDTKEFTISLFNKSNPIYSKFGSKDITINNPTNNIIYKIFQERTSDSNLIEKFKAFFYIEEVVDESGLYDSHFEREVVGRVKRAQYRVVEITDEHIKLEFIKIR